MTNSNLLSSKLICELFLGFFRASGIPEMIRDIVKEAATEAQTKEPTKDPDESCAYFTRSEVCQMARITETTLWRLEKAGIIKKVKLGRKNLYSRIDVEALLGSGGFSKPLKKKSRKEEAK